jgi:hypothetical protein
MSYGKTIKIFLPSGKTDEVKIASIANSTVQATLIPRNILNEIENYEEISSTGIYFLFDNDSNVYVGESENVRERIKQHNKDEKKDWWNVLITINVNSLNSPLTKAHVKYLEGLAYEKIREANRFILEQTVPASVKLSRNDIADMMHVFEDIKILISTLGFLLFEKIRKSESTSTENKDESIAKNVFYLKSKEADASGEYTNEGFIIYKNSKIVKQPNENWNKRKLKGKPDEGYFRFINKLIVDRKKLLEENKIEESGNFYLLKEDISFNSPSGAASFVAFDGYNGWYYWQTKDGKTLDEIYRKEK